MNIKALTHYLTRNEDGSIDSETSCQKLASELAEFELTHEKVATAVSTVFDKFKGTRINRAGIVSFTLHEMGVDPSNWAEMTQAVNEYVDANTGEGKIFESRKGPGGGTCRTADKKPE